MDFIVRSVNDGPVKSWAYRRLKLLDAKFEIYILENGRNEHHSQKKVPHRDFYNVRKVDTHVHHSSSMNCKHLLTFIKSKLKRCPDDVVIFRDEKYLTLREVFDSLNLKAHHLSIDTLDMHAHKDSFHRFDKFNSKYNPIGETRLREIFLKTNNLIDGKYLSELTKEVVSDLEKSKFQIAEYRISIYGRSMDEWDKLAAWVCDNQIFSNNVRWIIQVPRLFDVYASKQKIINFSEIIRNVFEPLFKVTKDPLSNKKLHIFLKRVVAFDTVDDESKSERTIHDNFCKPKDWKSTENPPYSYWMYYMYANLASLNDFRARRSMSNVF